ncbi:MAG: T9SS type A sorting domain-containing protein [Ignavibacterium sp.]|uniref:M1 family aminopeptidase n=1 Tax=Ignavibacterium sp. TaxID=2651167 RepID=UPI003297BD94
MKLFTSVFVVLLSLNLMAQSPEKFWVKSEQLRAERLLKNENINYPGDSRFDVTYYKLDLKIMHTTQTISGNVIVNAKADTLNVNSIFLDLVNQLIVDSVLCNGNPAAFTRSTNKINITLDNTYNTGESFSIQVFYHGTPPSSGFGSFTFDTRAGGAPSIFTLSEPYGSRDWWPCKDTPADKADSADIWFTVTNPIKAISNGILEEVVNNGDNTSTYKWKVRYPIAQYLISLAATDFVEYINYYNYSPTDSMPVTHYIYPETFNTTLKNLLDKTPQMIEVFKQHFGEYPFINEKYGHAQFGWGGGMEHQTCSSMGAFGEGINSHELAHQWYGDAITCKDWHNIWLNEGFATYAEGVWIEATQGRAAYNNYIANEMNYAKNASGSVWVQDISSVNSIFNYARSYAKGAVILHMLRGVVGDSTFYDILRTYTYHPTVSYGVAVTEDFQAIAESISGMNLDYFFQQWIYGENYPRYNVNWSKSQLNDSLWNLRLNISQLTNTNPVFFTMPVQINITRIGFPDTLITVFNDQQNQEFNIQVSGQINSMQFDPYNFILKNLNVTVDVEEGSQLPTEFALEQNYPNPFNPTTKIRFTIAASSLNPFSKGEGTLTSLKVFDILGNEVATLVNENLQPGVYEYEFDASSLTSGVYFYKLISGNFTEVKKMILMR